MTAIPVKFVIDLSKYSYLSFEKAEPVFNTFIFLFSPVFHLSEKKALKIKEN